MADFGRFKLTDAMPEQVAEIEAPQSQGGAEATHPQVEAGGKPSGKTRRPLPRASRRPIVNGPLNRFAREGKTIRPRTPKARFATGWWILVGAISRQAAKAQMRTRGPTSPKDRVKSLPRFPWFCYIPAGETVPGGLGGSKARKHTFSISQANRSRSDLPWHGLH